VLAILGTGSIVYAVNGETRHRIGGYGYLFVDAGSGYHIGNLAIQAAFAATDGSGPETLLKEKIDGYAGAGFPKNIAFFYEGGKRCIAGCAPLVMEAYLEGDAIASRILSTAMAAFAPQLMTAARMVSEDAPIVWMGGLMRQSELLLPILRKQLPEDIASRIIICREDPAIGALRLAGAPIEEGEHIC
jgi:N-acetylglucosamine kinase-like BadF-type ATPase